MDPVFKELDMHYKIHQYQSRLTDEKMDQFFLKLKDVGMENFLSTEGDMDEPSRFVGKVLSNPRMITLFPEALKFWMTPVKA